MLNWDSEKVSSPTAPAYYIGWGCGTRNSKPKLKVSCQANTIYYYNNFSLGLLGSKTIIWNPSPA